MTTAFPLFLSHSSQALPILDQMSLERDAEVAETAVATLRSLLSLAEGREALGILKVTGWIHTTALFTCLHACLCF